MMKSLIYLVVLFLSWKDVFSCPSSCSCTTNSQGSTVNCNNKGLTSIPTDIPDDVYNLLLDSNQITEIDEHSFNNMTKLYSVDLDGNLISTIKSETFKDLHNLYRIYIRENKVSVIEKNAFMNLPGLRYVYLEKNNISTVEENVFINVTSLWTIYFDYNRISTIKQGAFDEQSRCEYMYIRYNDVLVIEASAFIGLQVRYMYMQHSKITTIESGAFSNSTKLYKLYLNYNKISSIQENAFANLTELYELQLDYNDISSVEAPTFVNLPKLRYLVLNNNRISKITRGAFDELSSVDYLYIRYNDVFVIETSAFVGLQARYMYIQHSKITTIESGAFSYSTILYKLYLDYNKISTIKENAFANLTELYEIHLDNNNIVTLEAPTFVNLPKLRNLVLKNNDLIGLEVNTFVNVTSLYQVDLDHNRISTISQGAFDEFSRIDYMYIRYNELYVIEESTFVGIQGRYMYMQNNKITVIKTGAFSHSDRLYKLFLDYNNVSVIEEYSFFNLSALYELHLDRNNIATLEEPTFVNLPNFRYLYMEYNNLADLEVNTFVNVTSLYEVNLDYNRISRIQQGAFDEFSTSQYMYLRYNEVSVIEENAFVGLQVRYMYINNKITVIKPGAFSHSSRLYKLFLESNNISVIQESAFSNLTALHELHLDRNNIATLEAPIFVNLPNLRYLYMQYNKMDALEVNTFVNVTSLYQVNCDYNRISTIKEGAFDELSKSEYMYLRYNEIYVIEEKAFVGLQIRYMYMQHNKVTVIKTRAFSHSTRLYKLYLDYNNISAIQENAFFNLTALSELHLDRNNIATLESPAFVNLQNLRYLHLDHNNIMMLEQDTFVNVTNLYQLNCDYNRISSIKQGAFDELSRVEYLYLQYNEIYVVEEGAFFGLKVRRMYMRYNKITVVKSNAFANSTRLYQLFLDYNNISVIQENAFSELTELNELHLDRNNIAALEAFLFVNLPRLAYLYMEYNNIDSIKENTFVNMPSLYRVYCDYNRISTIKRGAFDKVSRPEYMYIQYNEMFVITENAFVGLQVRHLYMRYNKITTIQSGAFSHSSRLYILYLDYNNISAIQEGVFTNLTGLRELHLDRNNIVSVETPIFDHLPDLRYIYMENNKLKAVRTSMFKDLPRLYQINLQDNEITTIEEESFHNLPNLRYLYLQNNKLKTTGSKKFRDFPQLFQLNLQNNEISMIEDDSFSNLPNLRYLYLENNNITVVEKDAFVNLTYLSHLSFQMHCDCTNIEFWKWIKTVNSYATSVRCYDHDNSYLASLQSCSFDKCSVNICTETYCLNGGTCFTDAYGNPACHCVGGWAGKKCSVDPCYSNPCSNNGDCRVETNGQALCTCYGLWTGIHCDVSPCNATTCGNRQCFYNESGFTACVGGLQQCADTTTEDSTSSPVTTTPVTCPPCTGSGGLNRTDMSLGEECGEHGKDGKCTIPNSGCMQSTTDTTWKCRCAQGYAQTGSSCAQIPKRLFSSQQETATINQGTSNGATVKTIPFSGISGFSASGRTARIIGQGASTFIVDVTSSGITIKLNGQLDQFSYMLVLTSSVTIDNIDVHDFVEVTVSVNRNTLITDDIVIVDGTPTGTVVGQLCQSCFTGSDVIEIPNSNFVEVNSDRSIVTKTTIDLNTMQSVQTIVYSTNILVRQNSNLIGNLTVIIIRPQYTVTLSEDSTTSTQVGVVNLDQLFSINTDGLGRNGQQITLGSTTLNYEWEKEIQKKLSLTISGSKQHYLEVPVTIKVKDENDEAPKFLQSTYNFVTLLSAYSNLVVGVVTAQDSDLNSHLKYSISQNESFTIDGNGVIRIRQTINQPNYTLIASVTDGKFPGQDATVFIDVLQPTNVNLGNKFMWNLPENSVSSHSVFVADYENFHFTDTLAETDFSLDKVTGNIRNRKNFDREALTEASFKYTVVANKKNEATCSLVVIGEITITITDVNDEPPVFVNTPYTATVKEEQPAGEALVMNPISTTDKDETSTVIYSLESSQDKFTINSYTGAISTKVPIDRETTSSSSVTVKASDSLNTATTIVIVTIEDINDNNPVFTGTPNRFEVSENSPSKTLIGSVTVSDADEGKNAEISYDLIGDGGFVRINQTSGEITVSGNIDRETISSIQVTVYARDNGDNIRASSKAITIDVKDVNDNAPEFAQNYITVAFDETLACSNSITTISATDRDEQGTANSQIRYSVISGSAYVQIEESTGILRCRSPFDYETIPSYTLLIKAEDSPNTGKLSSNLTVIINVRDVNDNTPTFVKAKDQVTLRYFTVGRVVDVVSVTDLDSGDNGRVDLAISGAAASFLSIDNNGIIRTKGTTPSDGTYSLIITATDNGFPSKSSSHTMNIVLSGSGAQLLTFTQQEINMTVTENTAVDTDVESVSSKVNNPNSFTVEYEIIDEKDNLPFRLVTSTGMVQVKSLTDRESEELHEFVLRVSDTSNSGQSDLALVKVHLLDENDNPPLFERSEYFYSIGEEVAANTVLNPDSVKIKASDADTGANAEITFEIVGSESCVAKFALKDGGGPSVKSIELSETIDYEMYQTCTFTMKAYNQNKQTMSSIVTVYVNILDYNDNAPEFLDHINDVYTISIAEDTTINTEIPLIGRLKDDDSRENGDIELFNINSDCLFDVKNLDMKISLQLKSGSNIDYEDNVRASTCIIRAADKGTPSQSATATISITITDVNDNMPQIANRDIKANVSRDAVNGDIVVSSIPASDVDSGENGELIYAFRQSEYSSKFIINENNGRITVNTPIASVQADEITLRVIVSDKGIPALSATAMVKVKIIDDNPRPYLEQPSPTRITEHSPLAGGKIVKVQAYDRVHGKIDICDCSYRLDTTRDDLEIDSESGMIKFKNIDDSFDREREPYGQVSVSVIATDKDNPPKDSQPMVVTINIVDINDQNPIFTQRIYNFKVFQKAPYGSRIGFVNAIDRDEDPVTHYSINMTDSFAVSIDKMSGEITKTGDMTLNQSANLEIKGWVYAQDSKDMTKPADGVQVIITIEFDDKNKHTPVFDKVLYESDLTWDAVTGHEIVKVLATDNDTGVEGEVTYGIFRGNDRGFFKIDATGTLLLAYQLDSSIGSSKIETVNLIITATDGGIIPRTSSATVRIRISGSNPGSCIQGLAHQKAVDDLEEERNNWTNALYGVVAVLCVAILCTLFFIYKWRTSVNPPVDGPFETDRRNKYFSNETAYSDLGKRQTVEYSHSNEGFIPPDPHNMPTDVGDIQLEPQPDYPVYEWESAATRVLPATTPMSFGSSS